MGTKSKSNYKIEFCLKFDCLNRNVKCKECLKYSNYQSRNEKGNIIKDKTNV